MKNADQLIHSFNHNADTEGNFKGLTKREYTAIKCFHAMISSPELMKVVTSADVIGGNAKERLAKVAVEWADQLFIELDKNEA